MVGPTIFGLVLVGLSLTGFVDCQTNGDLRLVYNETTISRSSGRLEVFFNGHWGTVCDDLFDFNNAIVACRQLGFSNYSHYGSVGSLGFSQGTSSQRTWLDDLRCTGSESRLDACPHRGYGVEDCFHREDVGLICTDDQIDGDLRLIYNETIRRFSGRLEVFYSGQWGTVCNTSFDSNDAMVACRQLGFSAYSEFGIVEDLGFNEGSFFQRTWLSHLHCSGAESRLGDCFHIGFGLDSCDHSEDVGLACSSTTTNRRPTTTTSTISTLPTSTSTTSTPTIITGAPGLDPQCPLLPTLVSGRITYSRGNGIVISVATQSCNNGFLLHGRAERSCTNGRWDGTQASCIITEKIYCSAPPVFWNGMSTFPPGTTAPYRFWTQAVLTCNPGYQFVEVYTMGNVTLCDRIDQTTGNGTWMGRSFCTDCPVLRHPHRGKIDYTLQGTEATYSCSYGLPVKGSRRRYCINGNWTGTAPICVDFKDTFCPALPLFINGKVTFTGNDTAPYDNGTQATYECNDGFRLDGNIIRSCTLDQSTGNGTWTGTQPSCTHTCGPLTLANGDIRFAPDRIVPYDSGTVATHICNTGFLRSGSLTRMCMNGEWMGGMAPTCEAITCPALTLTNGNITFTSDQTVPYDYGTVARHLCNPGFSLAGSMTRMCLGDTSVIGTWSGQAPTCTALPPSGPTFGFPSRSVTVQRGVDTKVEVCASLIAGSLSKATTVTINVQGQTSGSVYTITSPTQTLSFPANSPLNHRVCVDVANILPATSGSTKSMFNVVMTGPMGVTIKNSPLLVTIKGITPPTFGLSRSVFARRGVGQVVTACVKLISGTRIVRPYTVSVASASGGTAMVGTDYTPSGMSNLQFNFPKGAMINQEVCNNIATVSNVAAGRLSMDVTYNFALRPDPNDAIISSATYTATILGQSSPMFGLARPIVVRRAQAGGRIEACLKLISGGPLTREYIITPAVRGGVDYTPATNVRFTFPAMSKVNYEVCQTIATLRAMPAGQTGTEMNSEFSFQLMSNTAGSTAVLADTKPMVRILAMSTPEFGLARPVIVPRGANAKITACLHQVSGSPLTTSHMINLNYQDGSAKQGTDFMFMPAVFNFPKGYKVGSDPICQEIATVTAMAGSDSNSQFSLSLSSPSSDVALNVATTPVRILAPSTPVFGFSNSVISNRRNVGSNEIRACVRIVGGAALTKPVTINLNYRDGTAKQGMDFTISNPLPPFNFLKGQTINKEMCLRIATLRNVPNARARMDTQFSLRMSSTDNEVGIRDNEATVQIQGKPTSTFSFSKTRIVVARGGSSNAIRVCVRLVGGPTLTSEYAIAIKHTNGTAKEKIAFTSTRSIIWFPIGSKLNTELCDTVANIRPITNPAARQEFTISMTSTSTDVLIKDGVATVIIVADYTPMFAFSRPMFVKHRGGATDESAGVSVCVELVGGRTLRREHVVTVLHQDGTARVGTDFDFVESNSRFIFRRGTTVDTEVCQSIANLRNVDTVRSRTSYLFSVTMSVAPLAAIRESRALVQILVILCPALSIPQNGLITYSTKDVPYIFGTKATQTCKTGFTLSGSAVRTCGGDDSSSVGTWDGHDVSCTPAETGPVFGFASSNIAIERGVNRNIEVCAVLMSGSLKRSYTIRVESLQREVPSIYSLVRPAPTFIFAQNSPLNHRVCRNIATVRPPTMDTSNFTFTLTMTSLPLGPMIKNSPATVTIRGFTPPTFGLSRPVIARRGGGQITACIRLISGSALMTPYTISANVLPGTATTAFDYITTGIPMFNFNAGSVKNQEVCQSIARVRNITGERASMNVQFSFTMSSNPSNAIITGSPATVRILGLQTPLFGLSRPIFVRRVQGGGNVTACLRLMSGGPLTKRFQYTPSINAGEGYTVITPTPQFTFPAKSPTNHEVCQTIATLRAMPAGQTGTEMNSEFSFQLMSSTAGSTAVLADTKPMVRILAGSTPVFGLARQVLVQRGTNTKIAVCMKQLDGSELTKSYVININYEDGTAKNGVDFMVKSAMASLTFPVGYRVGSRAICQEIADILPIKPVDGRQVNKTEFSIALSSRSSDVVLSDERAPVIILGSNSPIFSFSNAFVYIRRGGKSKAISACVQLIGGGTLTKTVVINVNYRDGAAIHGTDYSIETPIPPFNFPRGHTVNKEICHDVAALIDVPIARARMDTNFTLAISSSNSEVGIKRNRATVRIQGQLTPIFSFSKTRIIVRRGGTSREIRACVRLAGGPRLTRDYTISFTHDDGTARENRDYTFAQSAVIRFVKGSIANSTSVLCGKIADIQSVAHPPPQQIFTAMMTSSNTDALIREGMATVVIVAANTPVFGFTNTTIYKQRDGTELINPNITVCVQLVDGPTLTKSYVINVLHRDGTAKVGRDFNFVMANSTYAFKMGSKVNTTVCQPVLSIRNVDTTRARDNFKCTVSMEAKPDDAAFREERATVQLLGTESVTIDPALAQQALTALIGLSFLFYMFLVTVPIAISCLLFICYCCCSCCKRNNKKGEKMKETVEVETVTLESESETKESETLVVETTKVVTVETVKVETSEA